MSNLINNIQFFVDELNKSLTPNNDKLKKYAPHKIRWMGEYVKTDSGKSIWNRECDAKAAFKCHLSSNFNYADVRPEEYNDLIDILEELGHLKFVPVIENKEN